MADANFYRAFEDRHRGSRELIKTRLAVYLPFILPLQQFYKNCQGVDLGCGRGEWLELMQENGMAVQGIDLDQGMLEAAHERGLNVSQGDAIQSLQSLAPESQMLVSGFHLAEHLPFDALQVLIRESLRVLKPGGLLILETPNPENIVVGTANFYLDPTHHQPIPSQLLSFMVEYAGFEKVKALRLQEHAGLADNNALNLMSVLNGVSPDYAVVAQKTCPAELIAAMSPVFEADYGLSLESLANSYDQQIKAKIQHAETVAQQAEAVAQQAEAVAQQAEAKAQQAEAKAQHAEAQAQQADAMAQRAEGALIAIHNSSSWRLTAPLRMVGGSAKKLLHMPGAAKEAIKKKLKQLLAHAKLYINRRPGLRRAMLAVLRRFPALDSRLKKTAKKYEARSSADLTPRARRIYADLKATEENHRRRIASADLN